MSNVEQHKQKIGRPRLSKEQALSENLKLRMSPLTRSNLRARAQVNGISESEWLRRRIDDAPLPQPPALSASAGADPQLLFELNQVTAQLRKIGNNVNQLTRAEHRGSDFVHHWREVSAVLEHELAVARAALAKVVEAIDG